MKIIVEPIIKFVICVFMIGLGIVYALLNFIYDPKGMIEERKSYASRKDGKEYWDIRHDNRPIDWPKTLLDGDWWFPFMNY